MITPEQTILITALATITLVLIGLIILILRLKGIQRQQAESQSTMQADMRAICNAALQMGEKISRIEQENKAIKQRQQELGVRQDKMAQNDIHEAGFEQAIKLARKGSSVEEIMDICNLSRGEAELIAMMHRLDPK